MIKYYLGETPILQNAPTYLPFYEDDMKYLLENFDNLVLKDVAEAGGYGVVFFLYTDPIVYAKTAVIKIIPKI